MASQNAYYWDLILSPRPSYDTGLQYVRRIGIISSDYLDRLPENDEGAEVMSVDLVQYLMTKYIRRVGCFIVGQDADVHTLLWDVQGSDTLDRDIYIALLGLEAISLQQTGSFYLEDAVKRLRGYIYQEGLIWRLDDQCSQNIVWIYWQLQFDGHHSPFLGADWKNITAELQQLKVPDTVEAPGTHQFAEYLSMFCGLYTSNASSSKKFAVLYSHQGPIDGYELVKDLFIKISFLTMYLKDFSKAERDKFLHMHGDYLRFSQALLPESRARGIGRECFILQTFYWLHERFRTGFWENEWNIWQRSAKAFLRAHPHLKELDFRDFSSWTAYTCIGSF